MNNIPYGTLPYSLSPPKNRERKADYQTFLYAIIEKIKQKNICIYY